MFSTRSVAAATLSWITLAVGQAPAQSKVVNWTATEVWRIDGSEAGEPFAALRDFVALNDGQVWTLDFKDQDIRRYSGAGKFLGKSGRKGAGPGEMQNANGMVVAHDGRVWINDPANGRFTMYKPDGKFDSQALHSIRSYGYRWGGFRQNNGEIVEQMDYSDKPVFRRFDRTGKEVGTSPAVNCAGKTQLDEYFRAETPKVGSTNGAYPFTRGGGFIADGRGNYWCAAPRGTQVALTRSEKGDTIATAQMQYPLMKVAPAERAQAIANIQKILAKHTTSNFDASRIPSEKSGIVTLLVDDDGRLWVERAHEFGKKGATLDAFDGMGKHLGRLTIAEKLTPGMPLRARGNMLWLSVMDDDDVPYVVHYRVK